LSLLGALLSASRTLAFKSSDFKTCAQSGFCRRGPGSSWRSPYAIDPSSVLFAPDQASFTASVKSALYPEVNFGLDVRLHEDGVVRVRMDEIGGLRKRYDEAASWALVAPPHISRDTVWKVDKGTVRAVYGERKNIEVIIEFEPLKVTLLRDGGLLHMEHFRTKDDTKPATIPEGEAQTALQLNNYAWFEGEEQDAWWEETWSSWTDSKPKGPESLSLDVTFPNHRHVYGIPQHATNLSLPTTTGPDAGYTDPYRLYNSDVFEYLVSSPISLYGSVPLMHAHNAKSTVAIFNAVGSDTWIDVGRTETGTETHWISESGVLDVFLLPGPTPADVFAQYARLTGTAPLPAHWALGYHQCRWNYVNSDDVRSVQKRLDDADMPVDAFWLDIEYSEGHKYFIWDKKNFPDPVEMIKDVEALERRMVIIVDPHFKRDSGYPVYEAASELDALVKAKGGSGEYEGWCWPGSSSWVDFFNPKSWDMWVSFFKMKSTDGKWSWIESTENVGIWNDMNEPSVFNGPEISMPRDNVHYGGWEHRDVHNINGMIPFVLTRSFYAGSQRFGAMWTGDNAGTWEHMAVGIKMVLANGLGGFGFGGSDVGGFFGNPDPEMLSVFRAHAHIDAKRREPYLLDEPLLKLRYAMLPVCTTGIPIRGDPQYVVFPEDSEGFAIDDQFYIGSSGLLVKPVTTRGATSAFVYLSDPQIYYNYFTSHAYPAPAKKAVHGRTVTVPAALHEIPLLIRGGSIVPTRERPRRSSALMRHDPFTLRVALSSDGSATGRGIEDLEQDLAMQGGSNDVVVHNPANAFAESVSGVRVERVIVLGVGSRPTAVRVNGGAMVEWEWQEGIGGGVLVIRDPAVGIASDWQITVVF
ncbi:glycoside hydrolase family 31 protein, partial [Pisolithus marmoratus]